MDNLDTIKKGLYGAASLLLLVLCYVGIVAANAYSNSIQLTSPRAIAVVGEGRAVAKNDIANFTYSVVVEGGKDIGQIKQQADIKVKKIEDFVKAQGVDAKDIQTVTYNLQPKYQTYSCRPTILPMTPNTMSAATVSSVPCKPAEIVGYTLTQTDSVKIRNLDNVNKIVSGAVSNGANNVSQLTFTVDDPSALKNQAKAEAIKKAIEQAKILAQTAGIKIGKIVSVDDYGPVYGLYGTGGAVEKSMAVPAPATPETSVEAGSAEVTSSVSVRFEIQ